MKHLLNLYDWKYGKIYIPKVDIDTQPAIANYGEYCEAEVDVFREFVKPDSVVVDAGALWGCHTLALARLARLVIAFEPQRFAFNVLRENLSLHPSLRDKCIPYSFALGFHSGLTRMQELDAEHAGMNKTEAAIGDEVQVRKLDTFDFGTLDFIKLDVEGDEAQILIGAMETLKRLHPVVYLEYWTNRPEINLLLKKAGYKELWLHYPTRDRIPNWKENTDVPKVPGPPMLLALPEVGFERVGFEAVSF